MPIPSDDELAQWTPEERAALARRLDALIERPSLSGRTKRRRFATITVTIVGAAVLLPWIFYLASTLPQTESVEAWANAWIGYDMVMAITLALASWQLLVRRQSSIVLMTVAATLIATDAWFDVFLSWHTPEEHLSLLTAFAVEIPVAVLLGSGVVLLSRSTATVIASLRGSDASKVRFWNTPLVLVPPHVEDRPLS